MSSHGRNYDIVVIGAGIVGMTVALEMRRRQPSASIALLEKEDEPGQHASSRNSGVLHAGIYYGSDTIKAKVCSRGSRAMQEYARERGVAVQKTGKVVVAASPETSAQIDLLERRSMANGIRVERLDEKALKELEPHAHSFGDALYSPDTAVIDVKAVLRELRSDLLSSRIDLLSGSKVTVIEPRARTLGAGGEVFYYGHLINCAGAYADKVAYLFDVGRQYAILPFRGSYFRLAARKNSWVRGSIYPAPDLRYPFLGVHITRSISGEVYLGPTAAPALGRENYGLLEGVTPGELPVILARLAKMYSRNEDNFRALVHAEVAKFRRRRLLRELQVIMPGLEEGDLLACPKVGIRPQLVNILSWRLEMDFIIEDGSHSTHVLNAISPAFTSSMAFAKIVADRVCRSYPPILQSGPIHEAEQSTDISAL